MKSIYDWAVEYCGDPASHEKRGHLILEFLQEEGLKPNHRVLDVGCGALSQGKPLIQFLDAGNYVGLDPNGWLIAAALQEFPYLNDRAPMWGYSNEFLAEAGHFDFIVAHSVLSHVADWQLNQALMNLRAQINLGGVWLASIRLQGENSMSRSWVYPGNSFFRIGTVITRADHAGWAVEHKPKLKDRMVQVCPNDFHDWIKLTAVRPPHELSEIRQAEDVLAREGEEIWKIAEAEYRRRYDDE